MYVLSQTMCSYGSDNGSLHLDAEVYETTTKLRYPRQNWFIAKQQGICLAMNKLCQLNQRCLRLILQKRTRPKTIRRVYCVWSVWCLVMSLSEFKFVKMVR
jgi:hypothetical protein